MSLVNALVALVAASAAVALGLWTHQFLRLKSALEQFGRIFWSVVAGVIAYSFVYSLIVQIVFSAQLLMFLGILFQVTVYVLAAYGLYKFLEPYLPASLRGATEAEPAPEEPEAPASEETTPVTEEKAGETPEAEPLAETESEDEIVPEPAANEEAPHRDPAPRKAGGMQRLLGSLKEEAQSVGRGLGASLREASVSQEARDELVAQYRKQIEAAKWIKSMVVIQHQRFIHDIGDIVDEEIRDHLPYGPNEVKQVPALELRQFLDQLPSPEAFGERVREKVEAVYEERGIDMRDYFILGYQLVPDKMNQLLEAPVTLESAVRLKHTYVIGKTGAGKTNTLAHFVLQDIYSGRGVGVIAPDAQFFEQEILARTPKERLRDTVYFNPLDTEAPVTFNPLELEPGEDLNLKVDDTYAILSQAAGGDMGSVMSTLLRNALYALIERPGSTLYDLERILDLNDPTLRDEVVETTQDERTRKFWAETFPSIPGVKNSVLYLLNRFDSLLRPPIAKVLCAERSTLNFREAMDEGKVLLFNLSTGKLGEFTSGILGQLIASKLQQAALSREDTPEEERRPFYLYVDEFQTYVQAGSGASYSTILARARKYKLGLTLAHQQTGQIPRELFKDIIGNVASMLIFQVSAEDAAVFERELVNLEEEKKTDYSAMAERMGISEITAELAMENPTMKLMRSGKYTSEEIQSIVIAGKEKEYADKLDDDEQDVKTMLKTLPVGEGFARVEDRSFRIKVPLVDTEKDEQVREGMIKLSRKLHGYHETAPESAPEGAETATPLEEGATPTSEGQETSEAKSEGSETSPKAPERKYADDEPDFFE